jgi:hypothetical protein
MHRKVYQWMERFQSGRTMSSMTAQAIWLLHEWQTVLNELMLGSRGHTGYCCWYSQQVWHHLCICMFHYPWGLQVSQNLHTVNTKAAYRWAQRSMCGNMRAIFAVISWRRRGFPAVDYHRWWNVCTTLNLQAYIKAWSGNTSSPRTNTFRSVPSAGKVILMLFWGFNGPILKQHQDCGQMVNSAQYCAMLEEELNPITVNTK